MNIDKTRMLIFHLKRIQKREFITSVIQLVSISFFVILTPFLIIEKILVNEYVTAFVLLIAEIIFFGIAVIIFKQIRENSSRYNRLINVCTENPGLVTEIIISKFRIHFEIKGFEDVSIFVKGTKYRKEIIISIKFLFDESQIVYNNK